LASGTFLHPAAILARAAGLENVRHVSAVDLTRRRFAGRTGGLCPPANGAAFPVSTP
jgi:hypothetical protein